MLRSVAVLALCACVSASAQTNDKVEFEAATIKPAAPYKPGVSGRLCGGGPGTEDPGTFSCNGAPLWSLVISAYRTPQYQVVAPQWMLDSRDLFDVTAKIPANATRDEFYVMLQNLVKQRFKVVVHHETRVIEQYDLLVAKNGPKFKEGTPPQPGSRADGTAALFRSGCPAIPVGNLAGNIDGQKVMYRPADEMRIFASNLVLELHKPVRDMTGLKGRYEIALCWAPDGAPPDSGPALMDAVRNQLGLRLESRKAPADVLVVDSAEKSPTEN